LEERFADSARSARPESKGERSVAAAANLHADHATEVGHLLRGKGMARVSGKAGVMHHFHFRA
jgi:hypothetical protein